MGGGNSTCGVLSAAYIVSYPRSGDKFGKVKLVTFAFRSRSRRRVGVHAMARRGVFVRAEEVHFLEEAGRFRRQCIEVLSRAKPQGPLYKATEAVVEAIDGLAEVVAGDRRKFFQRDATTPGEVLPPVKWRTVE